MSRDTSLQKEDAARYNTPEKWFIRQCWLENANERLTRNNREYLRYLTLTSINTYDIRLFEQNGLLKSSNAGYAEESLTVCENKLHRAIQIQINVPNARFHRGRIQELVGAGRDGIPEKANRWFPYDVVNLDILGSAFANNQLLADTICKLLLIQNREKQSFSLFLTINCSDGEDVSARERINSILTDNISDSRFELEFTKKYPDGEIKSFDEYLSLAIPKAIVEFGIQLDFDIVCRGKHTYTGSGLRSQMISFIFDCEFIDNNDNASALKEGQLHRIIEILNKDCMDVNLAFSHDSELQKRCLTSAKEYTSESRFGALSNP